MVPAGSDDDRRIIAEWRSARSLVDVLADYRMCDLFARYLVETGTGRSAYHAALFGYCYLNDVVRLDAGAERDELVRPFLVGGECSVDCLLHVRQSQGAHLSDEALLDMFDLVGQCLAPGFERFSASMEAACHEVVSARPVTVTVRAGRRPAWRGDFTRAGELHTSLRHFGLHDALEPHFRAAFQTPGERTVPHRNGVLSLRLTYSGHAFQLTAELDHDALNAHNAEVVARLREDRDTCCYLQLEDVVALYDKTASHDDGVFAFLKLACQDRYGHADPGLIERIGRIGPNRDYFVVHCPTGQSPRPVRSLLLTLHPTRKVTIHPF